MAQRKQPKPKERCRVKHRCGCKPPYLHEHPPFTVSVTSTDSRFVPGSIIWKI